MLALPLLAASHAPRPATQQMVPEAEACMAVAGSTVTDDWCVSNCRVGNCPATICVCGDEAKEEAAKVAKAAAKDAAEQAVKSAAEGLTAHELNKLKAEARRMSVSKLNQLYAEGHATNDVTKAGLLVHQHDNTEKGWGQDALLYAPVRAPPDPTQGPPPCTGPGPIARGAALPPTRLAGR